MDHGTAISANHARKNTQNIPHGSLVIMACCGNPWKGMWDTEESECAERVGRVITVANELKYQHCLFLATIYQPWNPWDLHEARIRQKRTWSQDLQDLLLQSAQLKLADVGSSPAVSASLSWSSGHLRSKVQLINTSKWILINSQSPTSILKSSTLQSMCLYSIS